MSRRKRSGRLTVLALALVLPLSACSTSAHAGGSGTPGSATLAAAKVKPVKTLRVPSQWARGVLAYPLQDGESLAFVFPNPRSPTWTMARVHYPLVVRAYDQAGALVDEIPMAPCPRPRSAADCQYPGYANASVWVETRERLNQ